MKTTGLFHGMDKDSLSEFPFSSALVFSDLDGTLLDHDTYKFEPALPALSFLRQNRIPLILNSSKTFAEIIDLRQCLDNTHPFIAENGSVVGIPRGYFPALNPSDKGFVLKSGIWINRIGGDRREVLDKLNGLRDKHGFAFEGFADMSASRLAAVTGLPEKQAGPARDRLSTEPILWQGTCEQWDRFVRELARLNLGWVRGGRFVSISRPFDKKDGVELLLDLYRTQRNMTPLTIGLGDSPNDQAMLDIMDIAVVVLSESSHRIALCRPRKVIRTARKGPWGWQAAMDEIFHHKRMLKIIKGAYSG